MLWKLIILLALPLMSLAFLSFWMISVYITQYQNMSIISKITFLTASVSLVIHNLQQERGMSASFIESNGKFFDKELKQKYKTTDVEISKLENVLQNNQSQLNVLHSIQIALKELPKLRNKIQKKAISVSAEIDKYTKINNQLLNIITSYTKHTKSLDIQIEIDSYLAILQAKERIGIERAIGTAAFAAGTINNNMMGRLNALIEAQKIYLRQFNIMAPLRFIRYYEDILGYKAIKQTSKMEQILLQNKSTELKEITAKTWFNTITKKINLMQQVEKNILQDINIQSDKLGNSVIFDIAIILIIMLFVIFITVFNVIVIIKTILFDLNKVNSLADGISQGRFNQDIKANQKDEFGTMIANILKMQYDIKQNKQSLLNSNLNLEKSKKRFKIIFDQSPNAILIYSQNDKIIIYNNKAEQLFGYYNNELCNMPIYELLSEKFRTQQENTTKQNKIFFGLKKNKTIFPIDIKQCNCILEKKLVTICSIIDISQIKNLESKNHTLSIAVEFAPECWLITDKKGLIEYVNNTFVKVTGYKLQEVKGKLPDFLFCNNKFEELYHIIKTKTKSGESWNGDCFNITKSGHTYSAEYTIYPIFTHEGELINFIFTHKDITEEIEIKEKLDYQSNYDLLTQLTNRSEFEKKLTEAIAFAKIKQIDGALLYLDIDQLKIINDNSGHIAGDELIRQIAKILVEDLRKADCVARIGGDEFAIILNNCPIEQAKKIATKINKKVAKYKFNWLDLQYMVTISIGIAVINSTSKNKVNVMRMADTACHKCKNDGRNRVYVSESDNKDVSIFKKEMNSVPQIVDALSANKFTLFAQKIVQINEMNVTKPDYEILIRMLGNENKIIPPDTFLPAAERYNLSTQIDYWVIKNVVEWLKKNYSILSKIGTLAINLSGSSLSDKTLATYIINLLQENNIPPSSIKFEITETAAISNLAEAKEFILKLKQFGIAFALDDFGTGLSSFAYLKNLSVNYLKIDGVFVKNIVKDSVDYAMVKMINEVGHVMGMKTIAEYVEDDAILAKLAEIGVDYAQGYGISKPDKIENIIKIIKI